jgi:hypothetical protein
MIEQPRQLQLRVRTRIEPQFDRIALLAEFGRAKSL